MPICERVVCQESRRGHTEETEQRAPTDATRREIRGGAGGEILEASGEFGKDARPARRARPPAAARSALDASRTPPRPGCPPGGADAVAARGAGRDPRASAATGEFARRGAARAADGPDYRLIPAAPDGAGCGDPTVRVLLSLAVRVASRVRRERT
jgi:hypothetical protein